MPIQKTPEAPPERVKIGRIPPPSATIVVPPQTDRVSKGKSFYHSGNKGDLIYALLAIKLAGGGDLIVGPEQNHTARADNPIHLDTYQLLAPLLAKQPYLKSAVFSASYRGRLAFDLNVFRSQWNDHRIRNETGINLLAWMHCYSVGVHDQFRHDERWLTVDAPIETGKIIVNRSPRYRNDLFNWQLMLRHFGARNLLFVGLPDEHRNFCQTFSSDIEYRPVSDFLELAQVIAGSKGFIGNQSFPCSIAIGLGQRVIQEAWPNSPDCLFLRSNLIGYVGGDFFTAKQLEVWSESKLDVQDPAVIESEAEVTNPPVISVLCHNRVELTQRCLDMLIRNTPRCRIIVTNNASVDHTKSYLESFAALHPNVRLVHNSENLGYKDPHNSAFKMAIGMENPPRLFCILNNDLEIGPGWWQRVEKAFAADPMVAIVGSSVGVCSRLNDAFEGSPAQPNQPPEYVEGSLLVIRTDVVNQIGLFDPNLQFIYGEDSDLSLRARESGYHIAAIDLNCRHLCSQTVRYLNPETKSKIAAAKAHNHQWLKNRWSVYLKKRSFNYQVLVNREGAIGDLILLTPALAALKKKWPLCDIHVQTKCPQVFVNSPVVSSSSAEYSAQFDYRFDLNLAYERQPMLHPVSVYARGLGVKVDLESAGLDLYSTESDERMAKAIVPVGKDQPLVVVHPGPTNWIGRDWPQDRWESVIQWLCSTGWQVAIVGTPWKFSCGVNIERKANLQVLFCLMKRANLFLGVDSGPFHVAQAAKCQSVALFGTIYPHLRIMPSCNVVPVHADQSVIPCVGEHHRLPPPITFSECSGDCMKAITVDQVKEAVNRFVL